MHFKNLYDEISKFSKDQIDRILASSLYPVTMHVVNHFKYYPMFDATRFNGKVYQGNLFLNKDFLVDTLMPKRDDVTFVDIGFEEEPGSVKKDVYDAIFSEKNISVDLDNNSFMPISKYEFDKVYEGQNVDINSYRGKIGEEITKGQWNVLSQTYLDAIKHEKFTYQNKDEDIASIFSEYIKVTSVINVFGIYFFKETKYDFSKNNASIIDEALGQIFSQRWINEYKTKSLANMIAVVPDNSAKEAIEYVLVRKDSKEIAELGLKLIKNGFDSGWNRDSLMVMKKFASPEYLSCLYKANWFLDFTINELLLVEKNLLTSDDLDRVNDYINKRNNVIDQMDKMVGNIMNSGIREKMKSLKTKDSVYKQLNDFIKESSAHLRKDYESMPFEKLTKIYENIKRVYEGPYQNIKSRLEKEENKA